MTPNPQDSAVALEVERAAFEAHLRAVWKVPESYLDWALTIRDGSYLDSRAQDQWGGWQARASQSDGTSGGWISIADGLPELGASVALLKADGWENTGSDLEMNIRACGYLADAGTFKHWAIRGERATELKYFTHWMALPAAPNQAQGDSHD